MHLFGEEVSKTLDKELRVYCKNTGGTAAIVETTNWGMARNSQWLQGASAKSGVQVVAGTGNVRIYACLYVCVCNWVLLLF